jgi:hypothetical protein
MSSLWVRRGGLSGSWIEEAGFQACGFEEALCQTRGLKKQVVRHVSNSLQVREIVGEVNSPGGSLAAATEL